MLTAPGTPIPQSTVRSRSNAAARRARQVMALGLMQRGASCASPGLDATVPYAVALQMAQAVTLADVAGQAVVMGRTTVPQGGSSPVPFSVAVQMSQALSPAAQAVQSAPMGPATSAQGQSGAVVDPSQFSDAPQIVPMNISAETAIQANPQAMMERRKRRKQSLAESSYRSPGVEWGGAPALQPGSGCGPSGSFLDQLRANPLGALLIASGLGVMVYAVANRK